MAPGREFQPSTLTNLEMSPRLIGPHPWTFQPTTHSSYMRSILSPSHRPFIIMACSSTPQPGSTVPKAYRNGKPDILWCAHYRTVLSLVGYRPVNHSTMSSP